MRNDLKINRQRERERQKIDVKRKIYLKTDRKGFEKKVRWIEKKIDRIYILRVKEMKRERNG